MDTTTNSSSSANAGGTLALLLPEKLLPLPTHLPIILLPLLLIPLLLLQMLWRSRMSPISDIPGPRLASLTRLWHIAQIWGGEQNLKWIQMHDELGPFVRIAPDEVSVCHADGVRKILSATVPKAYWYAGVALPDWRYIAPMTVTNPKAKIELSKSLGAGYTLSNVLQAENGMTHLIVNLLKWMDRFAESGESMELSEFITYTTLDVVGEVIFSRPFGFSEKGDDIDGAIANNPVMSFTAAATPYYRFARNLFLTNPFMTWLGVLPMGHILKTANSAIAARAADPDARFDIAAHWLKSVRDGAGNGFGGRLSMRNVQAQASNNLAAGGETVSSGVQTFVYYVMLRRHPGALDRVRDEIQQALREGRCQGNVVSYADAQQLPYLQACIKEGLRIFSPVTMGLAREAPKAGITIGDRTFPQGTVLSINPWTVHYSKELWGEDAREFNPDRWFRGAEAAEREKRWFIPFGVGYNSCPGHHVAKMELSKITATLARDYDVRQVHPGRSWSWKAYFTANQHSWPVYVEKRRKSEE